MTELIGVKIGVKQTGRHACTDSLHLPNCYNPQLDLTACVCGRVWWRGQVGAWHSRQLRISNGFTPGGRPLSEVVGWDRYFLHAPECPDDAVVPHLRHVCGGSVGTSYAEAVAR